MSNLTIKEYVTKSSLGEMTDKKTWHPKKHNENCMQELPSGPVAKTPHSQCGGGPGSMSCQETRSHMPQLKILYGTAKTWYTQQINIFLKKD